MEGEINLTGWDFSALTSTGRMKETPLPWDYAAIIKQHMPRVKRMLDMGTGGGEFLKTLAPLPAETYATEGYSPNVEIAETNLTSLGVKVVSGYKDDKLPFDSAYFDLVINRHEYYDPLEVHRILKPGGHFITQQVAGNCDESLLAALSKSVPEETKSWCMRSAAKEIEAAGFEILQQTEAPGYTIFTDTGAVISYLKIINWLIDDFTVEKYAQELKQIEEEIDTSGSFSSTLDRFLIACKKLT
ncbi:MAG: methyltransferase domain-containing protein [Ignavibacteria bacterium]|nr:methyltransferase domain-containing protein [Ignavibacteria bacterium]